VISELAMVDHTDQGVTKYIYIIHLCNVNPGWINPGWSKIGQLPQKLKQGYVSTSMVPLQMMNSTGVAKNPTCQISELWLYHYITISPGFPSMNQPFSCWTHPGRFFLPIAIGRHRHLLEIPKAKVLEMGFEELRQFLGRSAPWYSINLTGGTSMYKPYLHPFTKWDINILYIYIILGID